MAAQRFLTTLVLRAHLQCETRWTVVRSCGHRLIPERDPLAQSMLQLRLRKNEWPRPVGADASTAPSPTRGLSHNGLYNGVVHLTTIGGHLQISSRYVHVPGMHHLSNSVKLCNRQLPRLNTLNQHSYHPHVHPYIICPHNRSVLPYFCSGPWPRHLC